MLRIHRLVGFALVTVVSVAAAERDIVRNFPASKGVALSVETYRGSVTVAEAETRDVRVAVHVEIGSDTEAEAEQMLSTLRLRFEQRGPEIVVVATRPVESRARFVWNDKKQIEPTFRVTVPPRCDVRVKTGAGNVIVGNIDGSVRIQADTGDIFLRHVTGSVEATTTRGDVVVSRCNGSLIARVLQGSMRIGTVTGRCELKNSSGDIDVGPVLGDLQVYDEAGTATVCFGRGVNGRAEVDTSGGSIVARFDPAAACSIAAKASFLAHVESRLPLRVTRGGAGTRRLEGDLNGGGSAVTLRASGGNIILQPAESLWP